MFGNEDCNMVIADPLLPPHPDKQRVAFCA